MKNILLLSLFALFAPCDLEAHDISYSFDSIAKNVKIEIQGDWVYVHLNTGATKGPRIIQTEIDANNGKWDKVGFEYVFIQDIPRSFRTMETVTVTWKVMKIDWDAWKKTNCHSIFWSSRRSASRKKTSI
jgi:hypothetical protein